MEPIPVKPTESQKTEYKNFDWDQITMIASNGAEILFWVDEGLDHLTTHTEKVSQYDRMITRIKAGESNVVKLSLILPNVYPRGLSIPEREINWFDTKVILFCEDKKITFKELVSLLIKAKKIIEDKWKI